MSFDRMIADLQRSGLTPEDIGSRVIENPERAATALPGGTQGYVIPYRKLDGSPTNFYRVKTFDYLPKYKQTRNSGNHVYFPKGVKELALKEGYLLLTEGEKKAACATKFGFPCVAFGGVDSWRNRTLVLPEDVELGHVHGKDQLSVKMPAQAEDLQDIETSLATGLPELIDFAVSNKTCLVVCFDSDRGGVKFEVQRAAAMLGFELRFRGIPLNRVKQLVLPVDKDNDKIGLDDLLAGRSDGPETLRLALDAVLAKRNAFPRHPNIRDFVNKKLQKTKLSRKEAQQTSLAILCELDAMGTRLRSSGDDSMYFFNSRTKALIPASLKRAHSDVMSDSEFSRFLYQEFGVSHSDMRLVSWLATQFTSEDPIDFVTPSKVIHVKGDYVYYQINDGQHIRISGDADAPFIIADNGTDGVLFESGKVKPLVATELAKVLSEQNALPTKNWWREVLKLVRLKRTEKTPDLIAMLLYLSPWLNRWRGTQLPVEMIIGEPGSGKSSLYELRLNIQVGAPDLRNAPHDMKDWYASVASTGGLHVTDNVQLMDKNLRQRLSDEMCRIVTEPVPHIEMRKYYTESDLLRIPVQSIFAITAIQQPFHNADLLQRSLVIELDKGDEVVEYDSRWAHDRLEQFGGRTAWVAHQLVVLHRFLKLVKTDWDPKYKAKHRLNNLEQSFLLMAKVLGVPNNWVVEHLSKITITAVSESDWALEGLCEFARAIKIAQPLMKFASSDIAQWAAGNEDFSGCNQLTSSRSLGRYMQTNKQMLATIAGIREAGNSNNRQMYSVK